MADSSCAVPRRHSRQARDALLEVAAEADRRGFAGIACPSIGGAMGCAASLAHVTTTIPFWTCIQPIYLATRPRSAAPPATSPRSAAGGSGSASASATGR